MPTGVVSRPPNTIRSHESTRSHSPCKARAKARFGNTEQELTRSRLLPKGHRLRLFLLNTAFPRPPRSIPQPVQFPPPHRHSATFPRTHPVPSFQISWPTPWSSPNSPVSLGKLSVASATPSAILFLQIRILSRLNKTVPTINTVPAETANWCWMVTVGLLSFNALQAYETTNHINNNNRCRRAFGGVWKDSAVLSARNTTL